MFKNDKKVQKTFWQRMLYSQVIIIIGICFIILFSVGISKKIAQQRQIDREIKELIEQIDHLEKSNNELSELVQYLSTDDFLEKEARAKMDLKKNGENVAIINNNYDIKTPQIIIENKNSQIKKGGAKSNLVKWLNYFFQ